MEKYDKKKITQVYPSFLTTEQWQEENNKP